MAPLGTCAPDTHGYSERFLILPSLYAEALGLTQFLVQVSPC